MTRFDRRGYTLVEALMALLVAGALTTCLAVILAVVGRVALRHADTTAAAETERTVAAILGAELRYGTARDLRFANDSVRLRAFRGRGIVCQRRANELVVSYAGVRLPEDDKDSVLVVWDDHEAAYDLEGVVAGGDCPEDSLRLALLQPAMPPDTPLVALVFETGAYSISSGALRYRRGSAGRQPLTEENLAGGGAITMRRDAAGATAIVTMRATGAPRGTQTRWTIGMPQGDMLP
jgi:hypothetical protein